MRRASLALNLAVIAVLAVAGFAPAQMPAGPAKVLVVPFSALNVAESQKWISKGVQENIVATLGRTAAYSPVAFHGQVVVEDNATASRLARGADAGLVIRGAVQVVGDEVRLTAQLIDAKSGNTVRTAAVTGSAADLLKMEDDLAAQLQGMVPVASGIPATTPAVATVPTAPTPAPIVIQQPPPQVIVISPPQSSYPTYYPSYASYPYYANYTPFGYVNYPYGFPTYSITSVVIQRPTHSRPDFPGHGGRGGTGGGGRGAGTQIVQQPQSGFGGGGTLPLPTNIGLPILQNAGLPIPRTQPLVPVSSPNRSGRGR